MMKNMKKLAAAVMAAAMILSLAACGGSGSSASSSSAPAGETKEAAGEEEMSGKTLEGIKSAGKLVMATSPDFPPFESLQADGSVVGIEVDLLQMVAEKLGVELEIAQMDFDSVIPGIQTGKFDVGVSGISVTEDRKENVLFTDPYCLAAQAIVVVEGSEIKSKADLEGKSVSVQTGTTAELYTRDNGYDVKSYQANADAELAVIKGKVDAWVIDDLTAAAMVAEYNADAEKKLVILDEAMTTEPYALAFQLGSEDLVAAVNEALDGLVEDGTVASLFEKYEAPYTAPEK